MPTIAGRIDAWGPMIMVRVGATARRVASLRKAGRPVPTPMDVLALLDTGASSSALDRHAIRQLDLESRGFVSIHTPSTGAGYVDRDSFDALFTLGAGSPGEVQATCEVVEADFAHQGFFALIGRDVLSLCVLTYHGPSGRFTLDF
jgi:hypothetical protein